MMGFEGFFESEASFPWRGGVIGEEVEVITVSTAENRPELTATCKRGEHTYEVALLDIQAIDADATTSRLITAYRHWADAR
jgi:Calcium binding